jgi:ABC-type nitrate/sulfonate/bicarbonate transport system substrate-binding protein
MTRRLFLLTAFLALLLGGCREKPAARRHITIGAVRAAYYLPEFVVYRNGYLASRGYEVELKIYERNTDMINDYLAGRLDVVAQGALTLFPMELRYGNRFLFIYGQNSSSYSFLVPQNSKISSLQQLQGKTVVIWTSTTADTAVKLILAKAGGIQPKTIDRVDISTLNQVLSNNKADAVFSTDVFIAQALREKWGRYLEPAPLTRYVLDPFFNGGGFITPELASREPKVAKDLQMAFEQAIEFIGTHDQDARSMLPEFVKTVTLEDATKAPLDQFVPIAKIDGANAQKLADLLQAQGFLNSHLSVDQLFYRAATN